MQLELQLTFLQHIALLARTCSLHEPHFKLLHDVLNTAWCSMLFCFSYLLDYVNTKN